MWLNSLGRYHSKIWCSWEDGNPWQKICDEQWEQVWAKNLQWAQLKPNKPRCLWPKTKAGPRNNGASFARHIYSRMVIIPRGLWHQKDTANYLLSLVHGKPDWVNIQINPMFLYFIHPNVFAGGDPFNIWASQMTSQLREDKKAVCF